MPNQSHSMRDKKISQSLLYKLIREYFPAGLKMNDKEYPHFFPCFVSASQACIVVHGSDMMFGMGRSENMLGLNEITIYPYAVNGFMVWAFPSEYLPKVEAFLKEDWDIEGLMRIPVSYATGLTPTVEFTREDLDDTEGERAYCLSTMCGERFFVAPVLLLIKAESWEAAVSQVSACLNDTLKYSGNEPSIADWRYVYSEDDQSNIEYITPIDTGVLPGDCDENAVFDRIRDSIGLPHVTKFR